MDCGVARADARTSRHRRAGRWIPPRLAGGRGACARARACLTRVPSYTSDVTATAAPPHASKHWPSSIYRRPDGTLEQDFSPARIREILQSGEGELWVDIDSTSMHQHALLEKIFEFHPLSIEDTLSPGSRVKFEEYDRYVFVVMAVIRFDEGTPEPYDLATSNLYFFLGKNFLVTVHALPSKSCATVRDRLLRNPELLARGAEMVMHN